MAVRARGVAPWIALSFAASAALPACTLDDFTPMVRTDAGPPDAGIERDACVPAAETCDGADEDCDGAIDEGVSGGACMNACGETAREVCNAGVFECTAPPVPSETCDGDDEDCDGAVDEDTDRACTNACGTAGVEACAGGAFLPCDAPPVPAETCDGTDEDCDGAIDEAPVDCGCAIDHYMGHAYLFCPMRITWAAARAFCQARGYDLPVVDDAAEDAWLMMRAFAQVMSDRWLGLRRHAVGGASVWGWLDDPTPAAYTNWGVDDPASGAGDCALFEDGEQAGEEPMKWATEDCAGTRNFVCESP